jgi:hypothetical protein
MRMNYYVGETDWEFQALKIQKQALVLGDGPAKVVWDFKTKMPRMLSIPWWDFFLSFEAQEVRTAEWHFHRSYWTKRQLEDMGEAKDEKGRPIWHELERVAAGAYTPDMADATFAERREAATYSPALPEGTAEGLSALIEGWHRDGSYVVFSPENELVLRAEVSPFHDRKGYPFRPFVMFQGTPDMQGPYSIPLPEVLEDHQIEVEVMRNQWIDQMTANINAPIVHDAGIPAESVETLMSAPNGRLAIEGFPDVRAAIQRMSPGQVTGDFPQLYSMVRAEAQMTSGVSDISAGQTTIEGLNNQTATGMSIIAGETNRRAQLQLRMSEIGMGEVAKVFDSLDRQFGGALYVPTERDFVPAKGDMGFGQFMPPGIAHVLATVNDPQMDYKIAVDAGSAQRPDQMEEAQRMVNLVGILSHEQIAPHVDWREITTRIVDSFGFNSERVLLSEDELMQQQMAAAMAALPQPAPNGQAQPAPAEPAA